MLVFSSRLPALIPSRRYLRAAGLPAHRLDFSFDAGAVADCH
ncbi:hypothetical protein [Sodalis-like endosymbiont of Proechinophthirus fluctus]|nr:hypothetical protein [Sodalis-like endosymbiont of Proechinophthirus fluctus]